MYVVEDWTGRRLFPDRTFATFLDGWDYIMAHCPEEDWQDLYVERAAV